jgi:hypothetical protein
MFDKIRFQTERMKVNGDKCLLFYATTIKRPVGPGVRS